MANRKFVVLTMPLMGVSLLCEKQKEILLPNGNHGVLVNVYIQGEHSKGL